MDKMREEFECQFPLPEGCSWDGQQYRLNGSNVISFITHCSRWQGWEASRAALVVELPKKVEAPWSNSYDAGIAATAKVIEAAGIKVVSK